MVYTLAQDTYPQIYACSQIGFMKHFLGLGYTELTGCDTEVSHVLSVKPNCEAPTVAIVLMPLLLSCDRTCPFQQFCV